MSSLIVLSLDHPRFGFLYSSNPDPKNKNIHITDIHSILVINRCYIFDSKRNKNKTKIKVA